MIILQHKEYHSIAKAAQEHDLSVSAVNRPWNKFQGLQLILQAID